MIRNTERPRNIFKISRSRLVSKLEHDISNFCLFNPFRNSRALKRLFMLKFSSRFRFRGSRYSGVLERADKSLRKVFFKRQTYYGKLILLKKRLKIYFGFLTDLGLQNIFSFVRHRGFSYFYNLLLTLETRLDFLVLRLRFSYDLNAAKFLILKGRILVNNYLMKDPIYSVEIGDIVSYNPQYRFDYKNIFLSFYRFWFSEFAYLGGFLRKFFYYFYKMFFIRYKKYRLFFKKRMLFFYYRSRFFAKRVFFNTFLVLKFNLSFLGSGLFADYRFVSFGFKKSFLPYVMLDKEEVVNNCMAGTSVFAFKPVNKFYKLGFTNILFLFPYFYRFFLTSIFFQKFLKNKAKAIISRFFYLFLTKRVIFKCTLYFRRLYFFLLKFYKILRLSLILLYYYLIIKILYSFKITLRRRLLKFSLVKFVRRNFDKILDFFRFMDQYISLIDFYNVIYLLIFNKKVINIPLVRPFSKKSLLYYKFFVKYSVIINFLNKNEIKLIKLSNFFFNDLRQNFILNRLLRIVIRSRRANYYFGQFRIQFFYRMKQYFRSIYWFVYFRLFLRERKKFRYFKQNIAGLFFWRRYSRSFMRWSIDAIDLFYSFSLFLTKIAHVHKQRKKRQRRHLLRLKKRKLKDKRKRYKGKKYTNKALKYKRRKFKKEKVHRFKRHKSFNLKQIRSRDFAKYLITTNYIKRRRFQWFRGNIFRKFFSFTYNRLIFYHFKKGFFFANKYKKNYRVKVSQNKNKLDVSGLKVLLSVQKQSLRLKKKQP
jgi:hypothetical protein